MPNYETVTSAVRQFFPRSKWQKSHYAWYKSQIKRGRISVQSDASLDTSEAEIDSDIESSVEASLSVERDLHDYLARRLSDLEPGLKLRRGGVEYKTDAGRVDILAVDRAGKLVVIEIKAGTAKDSALGQILGYTGCLSKDNSGIRGLLVASDFDPRVVYACKTVPSIKLVRYKLGFTFDAVDSTLLHPLQALQAHG